MQHTAAPRRRQRQAGFTILEIVIVVVIIGILAAAIGPRLIDRVGQAQVTRVKSDLRALESALKLYRLDNFTYPSSEQGLEALVEKPGGEDLPNYPAGGYLDRMPRDPWNRPYEYLNPGQNGEIDIYSLGADGRPGGEGDNADIGNWDI